MGNQHLKNLSLLILAALFISTSGVFGKYIDLPTPIIIWCRSIIGAMALFVFCKINKVQFVGIEKRKRFKFLISSLFLGGHWITYFLALKMSTVAIGMLSMFTFPVITALLEPFFSKEKFKPVHVILSLMILLGIYMLAPDLNFESTHTKGIIFGIISAIFYAIRNLILKDYTQQYNGSMLMFYQASILTVALIPVLFMFDLTGIKSQFPYLLMLGIITTALGHTLFIKSLKLFSASTASIIGSVQPIFGIIIAFIIFNEIPNWNTAIGGGLILGTVLIESFLSKKES